MARTVAEIKPETTSGLYALACRNFTVTGTILT